MDCLFGILRDVIIGLISGGISSWIVSIILKRRWDKKQKQIDIEYKKQKLREEFENDKQLFCRYLLGIRSELFLAKKAGDYDFVIRAIDNEPFRRSFEYLSPKNSDEVLEIIGFLHDIKQAISTSEVTNLQYSEWYGKLYQYSVNVLFMKENKSEFEAKSLS